MNLHLPVARQASSLRSRRRLLQVFFGGALAVSAAALGGCANRRDLPPERRTSGRAGHRDRPGEGGRDRSRD